MPALCPVCGRTAERTFTPVLWTELIEAWELSPSETRYIDRQQGEGCAHCRANLRSMILATAIMKAAGVTGPLAQARPGARILEINEAGALSPYLRQWPNYVYAGYPEVDMQAMPYADGSFDLVVHSDTIEHVPDPVRGLSECRRVGAVCCFTAPIIVGRMSRSREGLPPSHHGNPDADGFDLRVQTEFGADAWTYCVAAGFSRVTLDVQDYPAAIAITASA